LLQGPVAPAARASVEAVLGFAATFGVPRLARQCRDLLAAMDGGE
jgi:hypothetical protein